MYREKLNSAFARQGGLVSTPTVARSGIRLCDILPDAQFIGAEDIVVRSCCGQWDDCQSDDIYVAIVGTEADGHEFSHEAVKRGASAVVTERLLTIDRPQCIVPDTRKAYGKICQALAGKPSSRMTTIGVSGSDGKTVTSHLIRSILKTARKSTGLVSTIEVDLGGNRHSIPPEKLNAPSLADQLSQMVIGDCSHAVVEVSSVSLAQRALAGVEFDVAVMTNIREDHLDFHGSRENYRRAQTRLMQCLKPQGMVVLNADDPTTHHLLDDVGSPVLTIGMKQEAQITAKVIERCTSEQTFVITAGCESIPVRTTTIGDQHIYNCLAATAVGLSLGIELATIALGLERANHIPGRLERVECGQPFSVMIDSARSPNQLATAIRTLQTVTSGDVWCVFSTHDGQHSSERRRIGEVVERSADRAILTRTTVDQIVDYEPAHQVLDGVSQPGDVRLIPNRFRAIEWTLQQAQPGDAVLIAGCGEKPFALVGEENWTITDRDVCQAWLYDNAEISEMDRQPISGGPEIFNIDDYR
jgi:UDP-N-acetylmuramoyl-L-alanyl-D-glutamate--2,6-diaminopimelate ligase